MAFIPPFEPVNDFEKLLMNAAKDPAYRPQFFRELLSATLYVIEGGELRKQHEVRTMETGETMQLLTTEYEGKPALVVFSSLQRLQMYVTKHVNYLGMNAKDLFQATKGSTLILNPGASYGKVFLPNEIEQILDGSIWKPMESITTTKSTQIMIGQPAIFPQELVDALASYFKTKVEVEEAYLAHFFMPERDEQPHTLISIKTSGTWEQLISELGPIVTTVKIPNPPVDFVQIKPDGTGLKGPRLIYQRKKKKIFGLF